MGKRMASKREGWSRAAWGAAMMMGVLAVLVVGGCSEDDDPTGPTSGDPDDEDVARYTIEQTVSDEAQRNTLAFDGLAFLTGNLGSQSFLPPGKVADYSGFQYLRDNDPTDMGHNTSFVTIVAFNMLHILDEDQVRSLVAASEAQIEKINAFAYARYPLLDAFRRELEGDLPIGAAGLDSVAVVECMANLYRLDGEISYTRARVMGGVVRSLTVQQRAQLDALGDLGGVGNWDDTLDDPLRDLHLEHDVNVAVMTYASEMYAWYAGSVVADVYFCPERQATYFGSFFLKDWPAMGNPDYTINEQLTATAGQDFLNVLPPEQSAKVTDLVDAQRSSLLEIVERRQDISILLRGFMTGTDVDSLAVIDLSARYGELDGAIGYLCATSFASVQHALGEGDRAEVEALAAELGYLDPAGGFLYSEPITMPDYGNTDFLFGTSGSTGFILTSPDVSDGGELPVDYTCDGSGETLPLDWAGAPEGTAGYAVVMHHVDPEGIVKWYWILYDLPAGTTSLPRNVTGVGTLGNNSVDGTASYAPPCSAGPGAKTYIYTVYALSAQPEITVPPAEVSREVLLTAIADRTLGFASMSVVYTHY